MNSFVEKFRDEVKEYLERLESGLLILEKEPDNVNVIGEIFRLMHSMKGSGGMFGFNLLSDVTHDMESLYDLFRSGKCRIDSSVIEFTLKAMDGFNHLMVLNPKSEDFKFAELVKSEAKQHISRLSQTEPKVEVSDIATSEQKISVSDKLNTFFISFNPDEDLLVNGTNPLYLIDELNALGECNIQASFDRLPELHEVDPLKCYISWYLFIATEESVDTLNEVFIFVFDSAEILIEKVSAGNVIHDESIMAGYLNARENKEIWNPEKRESELNLAKKGNIKKQSIFDNNIAEIKDKDNHGNALFAQAKVDSIKVSSNKVDRYMNLISEVITTQSHLEEVTLKMKNPELELVTEKFGKLARQLRDNAFDMSLIPIQSISQRFDRLVHDLSKSLDKNVILVTEGMETELDKNIIEKLLEPLLHIVRNSMDHGIESINERLLKKKKETGTITIKAQSVGSFVQIEIEDDGAGLDPEKIREKAIQQGIISEINQISDTEIYSLIFEPGFSTSTQITDISGRGVGMDVVRRRIQELRGIIEIATEKDKFTRITIKLPLSLSIIDGLLTMVGNNYYVIPSSAIRKITSRSQSKVHKRKNTIVLDGQEISYVNLHHEFIPQSETPGVQYIVAVARGNKWFGIIVDEIVREYQAVVKPLGKLLNEFEIFSGASILGTGHLALVIDTNKIINKYF